MQGISRALANLAYEHGITIYHKYLEVGHTHMDCDSVHWNIERAKKNTMLINLPKDYIEIIENARKENKFNEVWC